MKKKIVSVVLAIVMTTTLLTACGGSKETSAPASASNTQTQAPAPAPAETPAPAANDDTKKLFSPLLTCFKQAKPL